MSIASEITRLQNAKADLKTSINAKTDSSHQITNETIDEYADFVDSIQTGGGGGVTPAPRLPEEYQEVAYIESSGTQYINTGYYANGNSKFDFKVTYKSTAGVVYGSYNTRGNWNTGSGYYHNSSSSSNEYTQYHSNTMLNYKGSVNTTQEISVNKGNVSINGVAINTMSYSSFTQNYTTYVFAGNNAGAVEQPFAFKLFYFKISENGNLIRDLVPCYRVADNVIGMYDLVNDVFYTNAGSGTFAKGQDVSGLALEDKTVTITSNGISEITASSGYNGLNKVTVATNVEDTTAEPDYVTDGMVAWFDELDEIGTDQQWHSRVGDDYIGIFYRNLGNATTNPFRKEANAPLTAFQNFIFTNVADYFKQGYTIELVGKVTGNNSSGGAGGWLMTFNQSGTTGIGLDLTNGVGRLIYLNTTSTVDSDSDFAMTPDRYFSTSLNLKSIGSRSGTYVTALNVSLNGINYKDARTLNSGGHTSYSNNSVFLSYYARSGNVENYRANGSIRCIRVYNRELTNEEMYQNYLIDKARFNLD